MSYRASSVTRGLSFISSDNGCPIPPAAPRMVTLESCETGFQPEWSILSMLFPLAMVAGEGSWVEWSYISGGGGKCSALASAEELSRG